MAEKPTAGSDVTRRKMLGGATAIVSAGGALSGIAATPRRSDNRFSGRIALVTGAARAQGRAHAVSLAREGAHLVVCDILEQIPTVSYPLSTPADLDETVRQVTAAGARCIAFKGDVRDPATAQEMVGKALAEFGKVDFLLANAGIFGSSLPVSQMSDQAFDDVVRTNLYGVFYAIRAAIPAMAKNQFGRIVVTSSQAGRMGFGGSAHFVATKWAVLGLVKSVAQEVAKSGITINAVCPGGVASGITINPAAIRAAYPEQPNMTVEEFKRRQRAKGGGMLGIPWLEPEEVSAMILYLLSDDAKYMTGEVVGHTLGAFAGNSA
jgi:NAD(P)-dependent dehydrogenase (short-subunit alcohol dehydrogenase family)